MNKRLTLAFVTLTCASLASLPASADNNRNKNAMVNRDNLAPPGFHVSPKRLQIVNESPIITDCTHAPQNAPGLRIIAVPKGGSGGGMSFNNAMPLDGMQVGGNPGVMTGNPMVNTAGIQPSTFSSNIPAGGPGIPGRALPQGYTTNSRLGVHAQLRTPARTTSAIGGGGTARRNTPMPAPGSTPVASYTGYPNTGLGTAGNGMQTSTSVIGSLRSEHLKKHAK